MFVDETWAKTNMTRTRGWSPRGAPLLAKVPQGHWKTLTFLAGLRHDRIVAPCVIDGPINGLSFTAWVSQFLAPTLSRGDIVLADNLGSHKGKPVRAALRAVGAKLFFLPAYSAAHVTPGIAEIETRLAALREGARHLAVGLDAPPNLAKWRETLRPRREASFLALDATQSATMLAGAAGFREGSGVARRAREATFVAIVSPSVKHIGHELSRVA